MDHSYPLIIDLDGRHKITVAKISGNRLELKSEFLTDAQRWVLKECLWLTKDQVGMIAFSLLDKSDELEGKPLKHCRTKRDQV